MCWTHTSARWKTKNSFENYGIATSCNGFRGSSCNAFATNPASLLSPANDKQGTIEIENIGKQKIPEPPFLISWDAQDWKSKRPLIRYRRHWLFISGCFPIQVSHPRYFPLRAIPSSAVGLQWWIRKYSAKREGEKNEKRKGKKKKRSKGRWEKRKG